MCHNATFYAFLGHIDEDEAARTRAAGCPVCGCALHSARYPRKPRGGSRDFDKQGHYRLSCGAICRNRTTPVSVRFLGRRVYWAAVVILAPALRGGLNDRRGAAAEPLDCCAEAHPRAMADLVLNDFVDGPFWKNARAPSSCHQSRTESCQPVYSSAFLVRIYRNSWLLPCVSEAKSAVARPQERKFLGDQLYGRSGGQAHDRAQGSGTVQATHSGDHAKGQER
jgi:hypothetical protein